MDMGKKALCAVILIFTVAGTSLPMEQEGLSAQEKAIEEIHAAVRGTVQNESAVFLNPNAVYDDYIRGNDLIQKVHRLVFFERELPNSINAKIIQAPFDSNEKRILERLFQKIVQNDILFNLETWFIELQSKNQTFFRTISPDMRKKVNVRLGWCVSCPEAPLAKRLILILQLIKKAKEQFSQKEGLVYTSFASGRLFQDYLALSELIEAGFIHLTVNVIDHEYRPKNILAQREIEKINEELEKKLASRRLGINKYSQTKRGEIGKVNVYESAFDYIDAAKHNNQLKSNIFLMVDPGQEPSGNVTREEDMNVVVGYSSKMKKFILDRDLVVFLPKYTKSRMYIKKEMEKNIGESNFNVVMTLVSKAVRESEPLREKNIVEYRQNVLKGLRTIPWEMEPRSDAYFVFYELVEQTSASKSIALQIGGNKIKQITWEELKKEGFKSLYESSIYFVNQQNWIGFAPLWRAQK